MVKLPTPVFHITHVNNLKSIYESGGLWSCNRLFRTEIDYSSIAYQNIQGRRAQTEVPCGPGGTLHDYVPFYFAPRSPMLYTIMQGNVESYSGGQEPLIYLVTTLQAIQAAGIPYVFTDGHGIISYTEFYDDPLQLSQLNWEIIESWSWHDRWDGDDRKRRKQAEFLVYEMCPWGLFTEIGVYSVGMKREVEQILQGTSSDIPVRVQSSWYYQNRKP